MKSDMITCATVEVKLADTVATPTMQGFFMQNGKPRDVVKNKAISTV